MYVGVNVCECTQANHIRIVRHAEETTHTFIYLKHPPTRAKADCTVCAFCVCVCVCVAVQSLLSPNCDLAPECGPNSTEGRVPVNVCNFLFLSQCTPDTGD